MSTYTDPRLSDVAGAIDSLRSLPLDDGNDEAKQLKASGTENDVPLVVARGVKKVDGPATSSHETYYDRPKSRLLDESTD